MSQARNYQAAELMAELVSALNEHGNTTSSQNNNDTSKGSSTLESAPIFDEISKGLKENSTAAKNVKAIIMYVLLKNGKEATKYSKIILSSIQ